MQKRILIVDDSESIRQLLSTILAQAGYEVVTAVDGLDAVTILDGRPIGLVLTDLNMPRMNGIALIKEVRSIPQYRAIPIVMITTESQTSFKNEAKAAGATGWVVKPFVADKLLAVITKVLR